MTATSFVAYAGPLRTRKGVFACLLTGGGEYARVMGMDENKGLWVDMSYPSVTTPGTYTHTMMLGFQYFLDHVEKVYVEKRGCEPEEAKKTYVNDVAAWFLDNGVREIEVPILAGHSADFIDGMDSAKNFFMKEIEKAKTRVVDIMKMEW